MRITIHTGPIRKKPRSGDEKVVKGVTYIRQQQYSQRDRAWCVSNGRPVWEWVEKESERDRTSNKGLPR